MASGNFNLTTTSGTTHLKAKINWSSTSNGSSANSSNVTASMVLLLKDGLQVITNILFSPAGTLKRNN